MEGILTAQTTFRNVEKGGGSVYKNYFVILTHYWMYTKSGSVDKLEKINERKNYFKSRKTYSSTISWKFIFSSEKWIKRVVIFRSVICKLFNVYLFENTNTLYDFRTSKNEQFWRRLLLRARWRKEKSFRFLVFQVIKERY